MSMKQYREDAKSSERTTLSRNGFSPKSNAPEGMRTRSNEINRMAESKSEEARGGKVRRAAGGGVEKRMHGAAARPRMDRFARGGHVKGKGKTTVNVIIAGQPGGQAPPRPVPVPVPAGPPPGGPPPGAMPPRPPGPPMGAPVGAMPPPAGMAPPMRKRGGKVDKEPEDCDGGSIKRAAGGIAEREENNQRVLGRRPGTYTNPGNMTEANDKLRSYFKGEGAGGAGDLQSGDKRGGTVKRAAGGVVGGRGHGPDAPRMNAGAGSGVGRMEKNNKGEPKRLTEHAA